MIFYATCLVLTGILFDKYKNLKIIKMILLTLSCPTIILASVLIHQGLYIVFAAFISSLLTATVMNTTAIIIPEMFHRNERVKILSWYYNLGISILGSTTPFVCTLLIKEFSSIFPFIYIIFISIIGSIFLLKI